MTPLFPLIFLAACIAAGPASAAVITLEPDECAAITAYQPADDVAYEPDVDVDGNDLAPADYNNAGRIDYDTDDLAITIGNPLIATGGVVGDEDAFVAAGGRIDSFGADLDIGEVTLRDGDVYFNGQRLTDNQARAIAVACAEAQ